MPASTKRLLKWHLVPWVQRIYPGEKYAFWQIQLQQAKVQAMRNTQIWQPVPVLAWKPRSFDARPSFFAESSTHVRAARAIVFRLVPRVGQNGGKVL
jgi:hypothetical protein